MLAAGGELRFILEQIKIPQNQAGEINFYKSLKCQRSRLQNVHVLERLLIADFFK